MKDELLMKYIDGTATPEEIAAVEKELSGDNDTAKEWMQIVRASSLAGHAPAQAVSEKDASDFVSKTLLRAGRRASKKKILWAPWVFGGVAVAAAVVVIVMISLGGAGSSVGGPSGDLNQYAGVVEGDSLETVAVEDTLAVAPATPEVIRQNEYVAETEPVKSVTPQKNMVEDVYTAGFVAGNKSESDVEPVFNVLKPSKTPYRVEVRNIYNNYVFEWEAVAIDQVSLVICSEDGEKLLKRIILSGMTTCRVPASVLTDRGKLTWVMTARAEDGTEFTKTGVIEFINTSR